MAKAIPVEQLIFLYNRLESCPQRGVERKNLITNFANSFGVSASTVYRQLRNHVDNKPYKRIDLDQSRIVSTDQMLMYCRLIAALKVRTSNKKHYHLSTNKCISILEKHGVNIGDQVIKAPAGVLKRSTIDRYLRQWGFDYPTMKNIEPVVTRFEANNSNDCWQFDFAPSDLKYLSSGNKKLYIANITDDKSGVLHAEYYEVDGEDTLTALKFLFNAMSPKIEPGMLFQGIPKTIYTDNGPFAKSIIFKRAIKALGIELLTHLPKGTDGRRTTARAKGKIERANRTIKGSFEPLFHLHKPENLEQANEWLRNYLVQYNDMAHRSDSCTRVDAWRRYLPQEGFREMCSWKKFCLIAREPEVRKVNSDACINIDGHKFQLSPDMAGFKVLLLHGVFDNELHVEFKGEKYGPFYPSNGPIPLHTYKKAAKTQLEKQADDIGQLAKNLSVPPSVMTGNTDNDTIKQLKKAHIIPQSTTSTSFEENKIQVFKDRLEAKQAISHQLSRPLAELSDAQLAQIDKVLNESLDKETVLSKIKQYFTLTLFRSRNQ